jgi:hypothetical protein
MVDSGTDQLKCIAIILCSLIMDHFDARRGPNLLVHTPVYEESTDLFDTQTRDADTDFLFAQNR